MGKITYFYLSGKKLHDMRPVVSKGFHGRNAKPICYLRSLPLRLRGCHLPPDHDLSRIQVRIEVLGLSPKIWTQKINQIPFIFFFTGFTFSNFQFWLFRIGPYGGAGKMRVSLLKLLFSFLACNPHRVRDIDVRHIGFQA